VRTLYLLRHAKSSWDDPRLADHERPLNPRGRRAAERLAAYLRHQAAQPSLVLCSSAQRARETLAAIQPALGAGVVVAVEDGLYGAGAAELMARIRQAPPEAASVMVIAHNPGLEDLALHLAGDGDEGALRRLRAKYPTGALATLDFGSDEWGALAPRAGYLVSLVIPTER